MIMAEHWRFEIRTRSLSAPSKISQLPSGPAGRITLDITHRNEGVPTMINVGDQAPAFSIPNQDGTTVSLSDHLGKYVLIWWYPKADTPG